MAGSFDGVFDVNIDSFESVVSFISRGLAGKAIAEGFGVEGSRASDELEGVGRGGFEEVEIIEEDGKSFQSSSCRRREIADEANEGRELRPIQIGGSPWKN